MSETAESPCPEKRRRVSSEAVPERLLLRLGSPERLEQRLGSILCCGVCLDLPASAVYQCSNGHLMCSCCFSHLLADARLREEAATCPNCRIDISKGAATRNLAVEKAVSELPSDCKFCAKVFPRHSLKHHEEVVCEERTTRCLYTILGCTWAGPWHEERAHRAACGWPRRSAGDVLPALEAREIAQTEGLRAHRTLLELLSLEKIAFNDLQLKPYRTDEFVHKLYYETPRFAAFSLQWVLKAFVNTEQRDPTLAVHRQLTYQLILKSKPPTAVQVQYVWLRGPHGDAAPPPDVFAHVFLHDDAAPARPLALSAVCVNRLLAAKAIHLRLVMFLTNK